MIPLNNLRMGTRRGYLALTAIGMTFAFYGWQGLLNNFSVEMAAFNGHQIGTLHSLREIPGFLAFTTIFWLIFMREQNFGLFTLGLLGAGVALVGFFPNQWGLYTTTIIMSIGFHYYETVNKSLTLQWIDKDQTPAFMGSIRSLQSLTSIAAFALILLVNGLLNLEYQTSFVLFGLPALALALMLYVKCSLFPPKSQQHKGIVLRKNYWLYYTLTFLSGARRQIFVVFAGFLLVTRFGYSISEIALLYLANHILVALIAPTVGRLIQRHGERRALLVEYCGLIGVFIAYALVSDARIAAGLFMLDHIFFSLHIAIYTYFQKIAAERDIASTAAVAFTINHIAAVFLPVLLGALWLIDEKLVFFAGALFAILSFFLSLLIPRNPTPVNVSILTMSPLRG